MEMGLKVGQTIEITVSLNRRKVACQASVLELGEEGLSISPLKRKGIPVPLEAEALSISLNTPEGVFQADCTVLSVSPARIVLTPPKEPRLLQRRRYARLMVSLPCQVAKDRAPADLIAGKLQDISSGGCSLILPLGLPLKEPVRILIDFPRRGMVVLPGVIARCTAIDGPSYRVSVEFSALSPALRRKLFDTFSRFEANWSIGSGEQLPIKKA